jgi:hypothetical protein
MVAAYGAAQETARSLIKRRPELCVPSLGALVLRSATRSHIRRTRQSLFSQRQLGGIGLTLMSRGRLLPSFPFPWTRGCLRGEVPGTCKLDPAGGEYQPWRARVWQAERVETT